MKLTNEATVVINGISVLLAKGTEVGFFCDSNQQMLEFAALTKLPIDLSYTENGKNYIAGAAGKFIEVPAKKAPKKAKVVEVVDTPKIKVAKPKK